MQTILTYVKKSENYNAITYNNALSNISNEILTIQKLLIVKCVKQLRKVMG